MGENTQDMKASIFDDGGLISNETFENQIFWSGDYNLEEILLQGVSFFSPPGLSSRNANLVRSIVPPTRVLLKRASGVQGRRERCATGSTRDDLTRRPAVEMPRFSRVVLASCLVGSALGFEQLAGFKMPSLQGMQKAAQNKAKFGDKKLAIVTGTSSGAC